MRDIPRAREHYGPTKYFRTTTLFRESEFETSGDSHKNPVV